jgi:integrase
MARPRKHNVEIPGLSHYTDPRTNRVYWRYCNPVTGKFHGLGTDAIKAAQIAITANERFAEQRIQEMISSSQIETGIQIGPMVSGWIDKYIDMQDLRLERGDLKKGTVDLRKLALAGFREVCGNKLLSDVTVRDIVAVMEIKLSDGKSRMAQVVRATVLDLYKEAQHAGEITPGFNPAAATKNPKSRIRRERITFDEWEQIFTAAGNMPPWVQNSMLLAVVTGQRRGDIAKMKFSDVWDDMLHVEQEKTGVKVAIPLSLHCDALGLSLRDVVSRCRDRILSPFLVHSVYTQQLSKQKLSHRFAQARRKTGLKWDKSPPTFHELRSLSERLYAKQGIDTQELLGHRSRAMTEKYHDDRGREWRVVGI